ncbi:PHD finger protein 21B-like [Arapaima gigas]
MDAILQPCLLLPFHFQEHRKKLTLRGCPVGSAKPISLKQPTQSIAISVVPAKAPVSMVTAHINGQKAVSSEPLQAAPVNLQMANKVVSSSLPSPGRRGNELPQSQVLGTVTAVPIKVPHVSSIQRLAGQAPTILPQVRPKTLIPDSLPHSPCQEQVCSQPASLEKTPASVSSKNQGPALPTANSTFGPVQLHNGHAAPTSTAQPPTVSTTIGGGGVAYAIISAASEAVKVQPLLFSADNKVIIIQPQASGSPQKSPGLQTESPIKEQTTPPSILAKKKQEEDMEKIAFMVALGLVTTDHLEEIQSKRQERKRRSTANPAYSGLFEPERKRHASNYLSNSLFLSARGKAFSSDELEHDERCAVCKEDGELLPCHKCPRAYHLDCLHPPLKMPPKGSWLCPKCQKKVLNKDNMSWPQNFVQSYVTHKRVREEEKKKLMRRNSELKKECALLEQQDQKLSESLTKCMDVKSSLLGKQKETRASLERLKALIRLIQQDQMIQVTMTATTTTGTSLLSLPWMKPTNAATVSHAGTSMVLQKSVPQTQDNN